MRALLVPILLLATTGAAASPEGVAVHATSTVLPCVQAAARAHARGRVAVVDRAPLADVLVMSEIEMTRALETGIAVEGSEVDVATIPWVLTTPAQDGLTARAAVSRARTVALPAGPASYEARRWLEASRVARIDESADPAVLRAAAAALVPLTLASDLASIPVPDVPALRVRAALGSTRPASSAARAFVKWLGSAEGQGAFAACGSATR